MIYEIEYLSAFLKREKIKVNEIISDTELEVGETIVVEKVGQGVFLARVVEEIKDYDKEVIKEIKYRFLQKIDLQNYFDRLEKEEKKKELEKEMQEKFAEIDKMNKYKLYANMDEEFRALYEEYMRL